MFKRSILLLAVLPLMAACNSQPIKKTNCWSSLSFVSHEINTDCEFQYVKAAR